jgi:hypothetical protein
LKICLWINANNFSDEVTVDEDADKLLRAINHLCLLDADEVTIAKSLNQRVVNLAKAIPLQKFAWTYSFCRSLD